MNTHAISVIVPRDRLARNLKLIELHKMLPGKLTTQKAERRAWLHLYREGMPLKDVLERAMEFLDEKNMKVFIKSLVREPNKKAMPDAIHAAICTLNDAGELNCSSAEAARRVSAYLGINFLSPANYRNRVKRLRSIGVSL